MKSRVYKIATRQSPLALWQANHIKDLLLAINPSLQIELLPLTTSGDRFLKDKLQSLGGKGLFVKELEEALLDKRADLAVHSTKDVPTTLPQSLTLAVICKRDNPFDAFVANDWASITDLPQQAIIGTTSLRRQSQLLALRPDLVIKPLRGNVNTRLEKLKSKEFDAIILAASGLQRLGFDHEIKSIIPEEHMLPSCAQGALSIECRENDSEILNLIQPLHDELTTDCVLAERHVNQLLGGNCNVPLAVYCKALDDERIVLKAKVLSLDGKTCIQDQQTGPRKQAMLLAEQCCQSLINKGAYKLLGIDAP